jgi:serpin B
MSMKKIEILSIMIACLIILSGIFYAFYFLGEDTNFNTSTQVPLADDTNATAESVSLLVDSLNDFSFNFYNKIASTEEGNIFFSPYSIFTALSMAYEGASNNTAVEMQNVLNILQNDSSTLGSFGKIYNLLNQNQEGYKISTANAFWVNQDYTFLNKYLGLLKDFYMAEGNNLDFSNNVEAAEIINSWIEDKTNDKIKDMIQPDMLSDLTKLVLTNAIYFKGQWKSPFNQKMTYETDFTLSSGETVKVNMMSDPKNSIFNYSETEDLQVLELDYYSNDLSMFIILPKINNITKAESFLNIDNLTDWKNGLYEIDINVEIPKFKFETKYSLNSVLKEMGIIDAFIPGIANFSGMDGTKNLFISTALHQAFIEVNEKGTEAAAATAIIMELTAIPDSFRADHPFVFLIQHKETGAILFMGRITDPSV